MPRPDGDFSLKPLAPMQASEVPRAGLQELVQHRQKQGDAKSSLTMWTVLTALTAAIAASLMPESLVFCGFFLMLSVVFGSTSAYKFWKLAAGAKSWQALPEGASETTALLEDGLTKRIREWNALVSHWNRRVTALDADIDAWRLKSSDSARREDGWSDASHAMESEALLARGKALMLERRDLVAKRAKLRRTIGRLEDAMRRAEQESQEPDPEPEDG